MISFQGKFLNRQLIRAKTLEAWRKHTQERALDSGLKVSSDGLHFDESSVYWKTGQKRFLDMLEEACVTSDRKRTQEQMQEKKRQIDNKCTRMHALHAQQKRGVEKEIKENPNFFI